MAQVEEQPNLSSTSSPAQPVADEVADAESAQQEVDQDPDTLNAEDELPLQYRWALWYAAPKSKDKEKKWDTERNKKVVEVGTVKEFWRVFNNLAPPSTLKEGSDLQLFRAGVSPAWEDAFNAKGGTWTYRISTDDTTQKLDTAWFNTVLTMIGDQFDDADDICGVVVSKRSNSNRLGLWIKHADDRDAVKRIGKQLKEMNRIKSRIRFLSHDDAKNLGKATRPSEMIL
jgi:translation initiation factor 4E